ncbi:MAG: trigger factor [Odoribacter splanchnicus]
MNITKNQIDDLNATIKIELGKEDYAGRVEKALKDYQKKVVVNGFRPGKTPMGIVKKMYGKSLLVDEINKVLGESLNNYIKENNLQILGEPLPNETEQKELNLEDENFEFLYDIALSPEVNAKMSKREKIPFIPSKLTMMIDKQIESICKNNGNMIAVDEIEVRIPERELIELDADGNVKEGGIKNEDASMSIFHMKDEEAVNAFR